jgi:hypothetical protein
MNHKLKLLASAGGFAVAMLGANPAFAAGTASGTTVTNTATVNYAVGGVTQGVVTSNNAVFTVDRKINLTVAELGTVTTDVAPGSTAQVTTFTVTNTSNATLDFILSASQIAGGTAAHGGTDNFDVTGVTIFVDSNGNNVYDAGVDTATFIDELAADGVRTVFIVANVPAGQANGSVAEINLTAQAGESGTAGTQGAASTQTAGANTAGVDTVFADTAGTAVGDAARDGRHSDDDDYTVRAALLTAVKTSTILWDPFNGNTNPKHIPGAVVEYCIAVTNAAGGALATGVSVGDPLPKVQPANTIQAVDYYATASAAATNGDAAPAVLRVVDATGTCTGGTAGGSTTGTPAGNNEVVSGTLTDIPASTTRALRFRVVIR